MGNMMMIMCVAGVTEARSAAHTAGSMHAICQHSGQLPLTQRCLACKCGQSGTKQCREHARSRHNFQHVICENLRSHLQQQKHFAGTACQSQDTVAASRSYTRPVARDSVQRALTPGKQRCTGD